MIREARSEKHLSLRRLASLSGVDYSRLARIEQGSRPAPDLAAIRTLAGVLDLDLAELLVAAGTARSIVEDLVWSERIHLAREGRPLGTFSATSRLTERNTFEGPIIRRQGALCDVRVGGVIVRALSFATARRIRLVIPPETVTVARCAPDGLGPSAATLLACRVAKVRPVGQLVNYVLAADGLDLNALVAADRQEERLQVGVPVVAVVLTAAIRTLSIEEDV